MRAGCRRTKKCLSPTPYKPFSILVHPRDGYERTPFVKRRTASGAGGRRTRARTTNQKIENEGRGFVVPQEEEGVCVREREREREREIREREIRNNRRRLNKPTSSSLSPLVRVANHRGSAVGKKTTFRSRQLLHPIGGSKILGKAST